MGLAGIGYRIFVGTPSLNRGLFSMKMCFNANPYFDYFPSRIIRIIIKQLSIT